MKNIFKPILFSTPMVQANLQGRKTQTRREIKKRYSNTDLVFKTDKYGTRLIERQNDVPPPVDNGNGKFTHRLTTYADVKPKYQVGDILWVRETYTIANDENNHPQFYYKADNDVWDKYKPSIHMPKAAARIFLYVTNVRVERLQDISEADAIAEGIEKQKTNYGDYLFKHYLKDKFGPSAKHSFQTLWQKIYGIESWDKNPYVWVYEYKRIEKPKDF